MSEDHVHEPSSSQETSGSKKTKRLHRSRSERVVGGVCGGLGEYVGVDPVLFRIGFVVTTVMGGFGLLAYLVAWLVVPEGPGNGRAVVRRDPELSRKFGLFGGIGLVMFGVWLLLEQMGFFRRHRYFYDFDLLDAEVVVPLAIIGFGAYLLFGRSRSKAPAANPVDPTASASAPGSTDSPRGPTLTRSRVDRKIAGVCGGIASHFGIDPTWVRLGAVFMILLTKALGLLAYFIAAIVLPEEPETARAEDAVESPAES